jgi:glycosyltransferase involved in cell wall biosynthesis
MRVLVATVQVPFVKGGGELHADGLVNALRTLDVEAELVSMPFRFSPPADVIQSMDAWAGQDFERLAPGRIDKVICLKFPTYYLNHSKKVVWLMHQHRAVYELFNTGYGESETSSSARDLREQVIRRDTNALGGVKIYANSQRVSQRLARYNNVPSTPLYHPPRSAEVFFSGDQLPYIFAPSRLESLKRHELLIRALPQIDRSIMALLVGEGGIRAKLEQLVAELDLRDRVKFLGHVDFQDLVHLYANSLGVFFGPFDEDYGYVTLEAMLSGKPVITCSDSGGPLEFVVDGETGYVAEPSPEAVARCVNSLAGNRAHALNLGLAGRSRYLDFDISWKRVVDSLLS